MADVEDGLPAEARENHYDCIVFSHVQEHLRAPEQLVRQSTDVLTDEGVVLIAVPNVLNRRQQIGFMRGRFDYADTGVLDRTFYTFDSAPNLIAQADLVLDHLLAPGGTPLWFLRRLAPKWLTTAVDAWGSKTFPDLGGSQILMRAHRSRLPKHDPSAS